MPIHAKEVKKIAELAKLDLTAQDLDRFSEQFQQILDYFRQLENLSAADIEPTYHALQLDVLETPLREDQVRQSLPPTEALANAPAASEDQFRVPKVIE